MFETTDLIRRHRIFIGILMTGIILIFTGCASAPTVVPASLAEAKQAIEVAASEDASHYAAAELDEARQKLLSADKAFAADDVILADRLAQQSLVTAELATARTQKVKALAVNEELNRGLEALTEEMKRAGEQQ